MQNLRAMFVDYDEEEVGVLGGGYIKNYLATGVLEKGFCVVTTKRVYFRGKCYYKDANGHYKAQKEERIVDLDSVTGSGFIHSNITPLPIKIGSAIGMGLNILGAVASLDSYEADSLVPFLTVMAISFFITFLVAALLKQRVFEINYAGGGIAFKANNYDEREAQQFQVALRRAKDNLLTARNSRTVFHQMAFPNQQVQYAQSAQPAYQQVQSAPVSQSSKSSKSVADQIKEYKELLDSGVITQEEFAKMKSKLLG